MRRILFAAAVAALILAAVFLMQSTLPTVITAPETQPAETVAVIPETTEAPTLPPETLSPEALPPETVPEAIIYDYVPSISRQTIPMYPSVKEP